MARCFKASSAKILFPIHIIHLRQPSNIWMKRNPRPFRQMDSHRFITRIDHTTKKRMTYCKDLILVWKLYLQLTPWSRLLREKLTGPQLVKKFHVFYTEPASSLPLSQVSATCPYPQQYQSNLTSPFYFSTTHFNIIFPSTLTSCKWSNSFGSPHRNRLCTPPPPFPRHATRTAHLILMYLGTRKTFFEGYRV